MNSDRYFGSSSAAIAESHFAGAIAALDVEVRSGGRLPANLVRSGGLASLHVRKSMGPAETKEAVGVQLGLMALGHLSNDLAWWDDPDFERSNRRNWRAALGWAAVFLISDEAMQFGEDIGWTDRDLARECGVTLRLAHARIQGRAKEMGWQVPFFAI